jgi:hypothetical protein
LADHSSPNSPPPITPLIFTQQGLEGFWPSKEVRQFSAQYQVVFPTALRGLAKEQFKEFGVRILVCNKHVFSLHHYKYLSVFGHVLAEKILESYRRKKSRPLWIYAQTASVSDGSNCVVQTTAKRMVWKALLTALRAVGYDETGRSLDGESQRVLQGTIRVAISAPKTILKSDFDAFVKHLITVLKEQVISRLDFSQGSRS